MKLRMQVPLVVTAAALLLPGMGVAGDFRKSTWGMTRAQVMAAESGRPSEVSEANGEAILRYDSLPLAGMHGRAYYIFAKDKLVRAKFLFDAGHADPNDFISDFRAVEPLLREQYGKPAEERAVWENAQYQDESKSYLDSDRATPAEIFPSDRFVGLEVSLGHLKLYTQWSGGRSKILHALTGENSRITHQIEYRGIQE